MNKPSRLVYLDWLRGLAILLMVQGHAFNSWLREDLRGSDLFQLSQMGAGFPAALFLFITGISLVILLGRAGGASGMLVLRRSGYILLVAFLFRLQQWAFYWPHAPLRALLKVDILNTMAISLAVSGAVILLVPVRLQLVAAGLGAILAA